MMRALLPEAHGITRHVACACPRPPKRHREVVLSKQCHFGEIVFDIGPLRHTLVVKVSHLKYALSVEIRKMIRHQRELVLLGIDGR